MGNFKNLTGQKFGRLTAIRIVGKDKRGSCVWKCHCDCGNIKYLIATLLITKHTRSCGCLQKDHPNNLKHGLSGSKFHKTWAGIKSRCTDKKRKDYILYGGRGITVCDFWLKFKNFMNDMYESYKRHVKKFGEKNTQIDRIDNSRGYYKENCRWVTPKENSNNRRSNVFLTYKGQTKTFSNWAKCFNLKMPTLRNRIKKGWNTEKALKTPIVCQNK